MSAILCILYYIFSLLTIGFSAIILYYIRNSVTRSCFSWVMRQFHITLIGELVFTQPFIYEGSGVWCKIVNFFNSYFSLSNLFAVSCLLLVYCCQVLSADNRKWIKTIRKYGFLIIYGFPLISLLMYPLNAVKYIHSEWCIILAKTAYIELFVWIIGFVLVVNAFIVLYTLYFLCKLSQADIAVKLFSTAGLYCLISSISWIIKMFIVGAGLDLLGYFIFSISGFFYFLTFVAFERPILHLFETNIPGRLVSGDQEYSWETNEILESIASMEHPSESALDRQSSITMLSMDPTVSPLSLK